MSPASSWAGCGSNGLTQRPETVCRYGPGAGGSCLKRVGREGVAAVPIAAAIAGVKPLLALGGAAVRPALGIDAPGGALLDPVVADGRRGVEPVGDVLRREVLDELRVDGVRGPHAGVAVGLELEPHGARLLALAVVAHALVGSEEVLDVMAVLVGDHVGLGERAPLRAEAS